MTFAGGPFSVIIFLAALLVVLCVYESELHGPSLPEDWKAEDYVEPGIPAVLFGSLHRMLVFALLLETIKQVGTTRKQVQ